MQLIDTHCHLTHNRFQDDCDEVIAAAQHEGLVAAVLIGTGVDDGEAGEQIRGRFPDFIHRACGLDPFTCWHRHDRFADDLARLEAHLSATNCVALGECGLEYFHDVLPKSEQAACLEAQFALALKLDLPVVIHVRDAHDDLVAILDDHPRVRGVIHSFDGTAEDAMRYVDRGWYISCNGMATFKKKPYLREAAAVVPDDRMLIETDSPFLAPEPVRGQRCEPRFVRHVLECVAAVRGTNSDRLAELTTSNAKALFAL